ncbi:hypothetical protein FVEG_17478 [Fusarium verticillioides 7600]|uniref:Uncharacterized protein n=1 Tax=Gibberella moniliformis (strain M3125 / FGSC 7600) TaxID=334819 RepID=W7MVH1_GIBM7|nr:hypothetical protein FVEG_17478 [Fusarium verticillioides 7600]EWG55231.1 hypothetical protein FVEG_17478 [Fusarium verticillioides 7600]
MKFTTILFPLSLLGLSQAAAIQMSLLGVYYNNYNCDDGVIIDILTRADPEGCLQPQLEVTGVASFRGQCG